MLKRIALLLLVILFMFIMGNVPVTADSWTETGESIFIEYNLVRYDDTTETVYYIIHNSYSCNIVLDVHALSISNASRNIYVAGRMESGKFQFYNDTCVIERKSFLFNTDSLKAVLESNGDLIVTSYGGKDRAIHFRLPEKDKIIMLNLFKDKAKDIKLTI